MPEFKVYAPLSKFPWRGSTFSVAPGVEIIQRPQPYPLRGLDEHLTQFDRNELFYADHWLTVDCSSGDEPPPSEIVNIFLLALWLSQPTKAHVKFRFKVATDPEAAPGSMSRLLGQFQWIEGAAIDEVTNAQLVATSSLLPSLREIRRSAPRLSSALHLTFAGCQAIQWQVALVCFAAAAEAILTYETGSGITRRLALAYACLLAQAAPERDRLFREFYELYDRRSEIMHGRGYAIPETDRLRILVRFGDALRELWKVVVGSSAIMQELEATDAQRKLFFGQLQGSYSPPNLRRGT
jgi:hypothetical protein